MSTGSNVCEPDPCQKELQVALRIQQIKSSYAVHKEQHEGLMKQMQHDLEMLEMSCTTLRMLSEVRDSHHDRQLGQMQRDLDEANRKLQEQTAELECLRREDAMHVCDRSRSPRRPLRSDVEDRSRS